MNDCILALNAGSSSIKCSLFATERRSDTLSLVYQGGFEGIGSEPRLLVYSPTGQSLVDRQFSTILSIDEAMSILLEWIEGHEEGVTLRGIGHRVVHGGTLFSAPVLLNVAVIDQLEQFVLLAPLHQPHSLNAIRSLARIRPALPQVACFDTAFHRTLPAVAQAFALPHEITDRGVRRYGFHGLSYEYIARVLPDVVGPLANGRVVVAHLMQDLLASSSPQAAEAIDLFVYRIGRELGSLVAALGGLDVLVFTAGIGEHAAPIRAQVCQDAQWLGVQLDEAANRRGGPKISAEGSAVSVWVIPTDEDAMIARHTYDVLHTTTVANNTHR